jgi:hypothetical protein
MPIDSSIPLSVRMPEFQSPMSTLGSLMQLQGMQQQAQSNSMLLQQRQREVQDDHAIRSAIQKHAAPGGMPDYDSAAADLDASGFGSAAVKLRTSVYQQRKELGESIAKQQENLKTRLGLAAQIAQGIDDESSFQRGKKAISSLIGEDLAANLGDTYDPVTVKRGIKWGMSAKDNAEAQHNAAQDALRAIDLQQQGPKKQADAFEAWTKSASTLFSIANTPEGWQKAQALLKQGGAPDTVLAQFAGEWSPDAQKAASQIGISPEQRATLAGQAAGRAETARHNLTEEGIQRQTQTREDKKFAVTYGAGVDEQGKPLPENATARAIAEYRIPPPSSRSLASGPGMALMDQVMKINPDYRGEEFPTRTKMRASFTSGPQSQTINSLNTAIEHLDQFVDAAKALNNGNFQPGNSAYNALRTAFGSTAPTNFEGIKSIMAGELAAAFKKSGATDTEIASVEKSINSKASATQLVDYATKVAMPALGSKAASFNEQYHSVMGEKDPWSPISKGAKSVLSKYGYDSSAPTMGGPSGAGMVKLQAPDGSVRSVPASQAAHYTALGAKVVP